MPAEPHDSGADARPRRNVYSVSRLNREVRALLERGLGVVWVEGELSNLSQPASGHWYFSLKDRDAQLRCAMFRLKNALVGFTPRAGQQVLVRGRISLYEAARRVPADRRAPGGGRRRRAAARVRAAEDAASPPKGCSRSSASARCRASRGASASITSPSRGGAARYPAHSGAPLSARRGAHLSDRRCRARPRCRRWWRRWSAPRSAPSATC